jgi:glycosyltransferase involved in cell wall biosynthesis
LGYVGRLDIHKGIPCLLNALAKLLQVYPQAQLHIVGDGPDHQVLLEQVKRLDVVDAVHFHPVVPQSELPSFYHLFDYLVFPTELPETLGLVGIEAMACGVPVIAPDQAGVRDYLIDQYNGFNFVAGNEQNLFMVMKTAIEQPVASYATLAKQAQSTAQRYDANKVGALLKQALTFGHLD